jgi:hypothetical protein
VECLFVFQTEENSTQTTRPISTKLGVWHKIYGAVLVLLYFNSNFTEVNE